MGRKSPFQHKVRKHRRRVNGKIVNVSSYTRGEGKPSPHRSLGQTVVSTRRVTREELENLHGSQTEIPIKKGASKLKVREGSWKDIGLYSKRIVVPKGTTLFHVSVHEKIKAFAPIPTAFSTENPVLPGYVYILKVLDPIKAEEVDRNEVRINLGEVVPSHVKIEYIGTWRGGDEFIVDKFGRTVHRFKKADFHPKYKDLAKKLEMQDRKMWEKTVKKYGHKIVKK